MKTDNRQKLLLILTGIVAAFFIGDKLVYSPLVKLWHTRNQEIAKLRTDVKDGTDLIRREQFTRARWDDMRTNSLANTQHVAQEQMLRALQDWAQESGASLNGMTPQWKAGETDDYKTLVCRVDVSGKIWVLTKFIYDIEQGPMGLKLESADLSSKDNLGQELTMGLQVSGLVLNSQAK